MSSEGKEKEEKGVEMLPVVSPSQGKTPKKPEENEEETTMEIEDEELKEDEIKENEETVQMVEHTDMSMTYGHGTDVMSVEGVQDDKEEGKVSDEEDSTKETEGMSVEAISMPLTIICCVFRTD